MKYGIIANPVAGRLDVDRKISLLKEVSNILSDCVVAGLDTQSSAEFRDCARELAKKVDVLIVAGGDGSISDVINSIDPAEVVLSYLPFGSGNVLRHTLGLPKSIPRIAERIRDGRERSFDIILCNNDKRALFASLGIDGHVLVERTKFLEQGVTGFNAYARAAIKSLFGGCERMEVKVSIDGEIFYVQHSLSIIITKVPFYGYGLRLVPKAKPDDGYLHVLSISSGIFGVMYGVATSLTCGNRIGEYRFGRSVRITSTNTVFLQLDGSLQNSSTDFEFRILAGQLKIRC